MPYYVLKASNRPEAAIGEITIEAARNCTLLDYEPMKKVPGFRVKDEIIAYASPDSTYSVTKRMMDAARKSIRIGIYDFTSGYMKELLLNAMSRGVEVTLMLDVEPGAEKIMFDQLIEMGVNGVPAPACTSGKAKYFSSCHEKFIVIDDKWTLVQSGNYSNNSIPLNEVDGGDPDNFVKGNRDTGLAIKSTALAKFFTKVLQSDIALEQNAPESAQFARMKAPDVVWIEAAPKKIPTKLFPSKTIALETPLEIQPVLSPDNYMSVIPDFLRGARKSILIEQQYIRASQAQITILLDAMAEAAAANPDLDVRIILGKIFGGAKEVAKEKKNLDLIKKKYGWALGKNIRLIDTTRFVHCHNKLIVVDGKSVLVSSQNWSDSAVIKNREAGILLKHPAIAKYFAAIFESDWSTGIKTLPKPAAAKVTPEALTKGGFVRVEPADYREV